MAYRYEVLEWIVENFCCYDEQIHDVFIESPKFVHERTTTFKLYPKGILCKDGVLSVRISNMSGGKEIPGDLSLITADGTILWLHLLKSQSDIFKGPKYEDVVRHIRKIHKDQLKLLIRFRSRKEVHHVMRTIIDVSRMSFKLGPSIVDRLITGRHIPTYTDIANIKCLMDGTLMTLQSRKILVASQGHENIELLEFALIPKSSSSEFLVKSRVTFLNPAGVILKTEENRRFIRMKKTWAFLNSPLKKSEIAGKGVSLIIYFEIIGGYIRTRHTQTSCLLEDVVGRFPQLDLACISVENLPSALSEDLKSLYQNREYSDLVIHLNGVPFPVHKNILTARSPILKRILSTGKSGEVDFSDMDVPTLSQFLIYLYTGVLKDVGKESALKLYEAAVKYQVPSLKRTCSEVLGRSISLANVCDILTLSDKYQDSVLTAAVHIFMLNNHIVDSKEWNNFLERQPLLGARTTTALAGEKYVTCGNPK